jgi:O-antigen ligase
MAEADKGRAMSRIPPLTLTAAVAVALVGAWWFSLRVLIDTPVVNLTLPRIAVLAGLAVLPFVGVSGLVARRDWPVLAIGAALLGWLIVASVLRGNSADLRGMLVFAIFGGGAFVVAFAAIRREGERAVAMLVGLMAAAVVVAFFSVVLERFVYRPNSSDAFDWLWVLARPQGGFVDPVLGQMTPPPEHFQAGVTLRASGLFAHVNYLAFFALLVAPLFAVRAGQAFERRSWRSFGVSAALLAATALVCLWTYSRTGAIGLLAAVGLAILMERVAAIGSSRRRPAVLPAAVTALVVAAALGLGIAQDPTAAQRIVAIGSIPGFQSSTSAPAAGPSHTPAPGSSEDVREMALRAESIRLGMQRAAVSMLLDSPGSMAIGPGLNAYGTATHDPSDRLYQSQAEDLRDPNSMWLTFGVAGGLPGMAIVMALLLTVWLAVVQAVRRTSGARRQAALWLAVWLPVWFLCQFFGTNPFTTSEAVLMGAFLGFAAGLRPARSPQPDR